MFSGQTLDTTAEKYLRMLFRNPDTWTGPAGKERIMRALDTYADMAMDTGKGADMFGNVPEPETIMDIALERQEGPQTAAMFSRPVLNPDVQKAVGDTIRRIAPGCKIENQASHV